MRLLCVNRPGYGRSSRAASTHATVADDVAAVLDLLGIVATLPMDGTAEESVEQAMEQARPEFEAWASGIDIADVNDTALAARWAGSLPEKDAAIIRRLPVAAVAASAREALADHHGFLRDAALLHQPWNIDLASVACPTHLWYGEADQRAMPGARWFADRIPHASLVVRPHSTHLATLADHWPDILANLTDRPFPC